MLRDAAQQLDCRPRWRCRTATRRVLDDTGSRREGLTVMLVISRVAPLLTWMASTMLFMSSITASWWSAIPRIGQHCHRSTSCRHTKQWHTSTDKDLVVALLASGPQMGVCTEFLSFSVELHCFIRSRAAPLGERDTCRPCAMITSPSFHVDRCSRTVPAQHASVLQEWLPKSQSTLSRDLFWQQIHWVCRHAGQFSASNNLSRVPPTWT